MHVFALINRRRGSNLFGGDFLSSDVQWWLDLKHFLHLMVNSYVSAICCVKFC
jgi:hypothetical protein